VSPRGPAAPVSAPTAASIAEAVSAPPPAHAAPSITIAIGTSMAEAERKLILATLEHFSQQKERTAAALGVSLKTLYNRLKEYSQDKADATPE
jgi:two-component system response regulator AtoC